MTVADPTLALERRLGYSFRKPALLVQALTHRSFGADHNERLEFLGDSVLGLAMSGLLYERFAGSDEGDLSRVRANLVRQESLHRIALLLDLPAHVRLGEGEARSGGAARPSILADALEAIFGAVYLDGGFEAARDLIHRLFASVVTQPRAAYRGQGSQDRTAGMAAGTQAGYADLRHCRDPWAGAPAAVRGALQRPVLGISATGEGSSRRAAEQVAAQAVLTKLKASGR